MPRRRFFISRDGIEDGVAVLTADQAHHLKDVLRLQSGTEVELIDGQGCSYAGIVECRGSRVRVTSLRELSPAQEFGTRLALAAALIKSDRFEWILQKGTELGVDRFLPLETRYTTVHIPQTRLRERMERWRRILREASKQSRRLTIPEIQDPLSFEELTSSSEYLGYSKFLLYEKATAPLRTHPLPEGPLLLCIGPEGGWDPSEAELAEKAGFNAVRIGSAILRAETAAVAAVAIFQFLMAKEP